MKVFLITDGSALQEIFTDLNAVPIVLPFDRFNSNRLYHKVYYIIYRFFCSEKLHSPFMNQWIRLMIRHWGIKKNDIAIIEGMATRSSFWHIRIIEELKRKKIKTVFLCLDSIGTDLKAWSEPIVKASTSVDLFYTFDKADAFRYHWKHTYKYYSRINTAKKAPHKFDVFCVFYHGGRLRTAVQIYDLLTAKGISCSFYIVGASEEEQKQYTREGITYNQWLSYKDTIQKILESNVILEITKSQNYAQTLRPFEAIVYNKKLLTNYASINELPFYNPQYMKSFQELSDIEIIDPGFFKNGDEVDYHYDGSFSPKLLLEEILHETD